jgi:hypothetical protein
VTSINSWRRIPAERWQMLPAALAAVAIVRLFLRVLPLPTWERIATRLRERRRSGPSQVASQDVAWAVRRASRLIPRASCLTQALSAQLLLSRQGHTSQLRIGVAREQRNGLRAHAWLESGGRVVIGGAGADVYEPLSSITPFKERQHETALDRQASA